ncbi:MAG: hypothetical protein QRY74_03180 [Chlamydia sp.]
MPDNTIGNNSPSIDWGKLGLEAPLIKNHGDKELSLDEITGLVLNSDTIKSASPMEREVLKGTLRIAIGDPTLPEADRILAEKFLTALSRFKEDSPVSEKGAITHTKAQNDWMNVSSVVDLFSSANLIAMLISRMSRSESQLRQALGQTMLAMAKESMNLTIQSGEARAQQFEAEAQKCWLEFGMALGQIAITTTTLFATYSREQEALKTMVGKGPDGKLTAKQQMQAHQSAAESTKPLSEIATSTLTAIKSAIEAGINLEKAGLERSAALADGVKQLLDKIFQMLNDTYSMLGDDMREQRQTIEKLLQMVEAAQKTMSDQWKA